MAHGESFEIVTLESDEEILEQELLQSESVSVENYYIDELSYNEYLKTRCELELSKGNQVSNSTKERKKVDDSVEYGGEMIWCDVMWNENGRICKFDFPNSKKRVRWIM